MINRRFANHPFSVAPTYKRTTATGTGVSFAGTGHLAISININSYY